MGQPVEAAVKVMLVPVSWGDPGEGVSLTDVQLCRVRLKVWAGRKASVQPREPHWVPELLASRAHAVYR